VDSNLKNLPEIGIPVIRYYSKLRLKSFLHSPCR